MTNATGSLKFSFVGILLGLVVGCGGGAASSNDVPAAPAELNEAGFISIAESAEQPGYCGYREFGVDESGNKIVEDERYFYPVINRLLDEDPDLRLSTGLSRVSNCEEGRRFVKANNEYQDKRARPPIDKAKLLAGFPTMPAEPPKRDPNAPVEKIITLNDDDAIEEIIGFGFIDQGKTLNCTGIRLAGALFLTAAHCLSIVTHPAVAPYVISMPNAWVKHVINNDVLGDLYTTDPARCQNLGKNQSCAVLALDGYMNPNYAGSGDYRNDVAVLHVRNDSQAFLRSVSSAGSDFGTNVAFISTVTPHVGDQVKAVGWGPNGNFDMGLLPSDYFMRYSAEHPIASVDNSPLAVVNDVYQGHSFSTLAAADAQLCRGDSGGGFYDQYSHLVGVTSFAQTFDTTHTSCAKIGTAQFAARTDFHALNFIPKAMLTLQRGSDSTLCTCAFFPSSSDPTGKNPEVAGAHIKCNVGCEDPAKWTN